VRDGQFRSLFAAMLEQHPRGLGNAVGGRERGREDLGLHIIMSTNATVSTAPTVAMKRGDKTQPQVQDRPLSRSFCNTSMYCFITSPHAPSYNGGVRRYFNLTETQVWSKCYVQYMHSADARQTRVANQGNRLQEIVLRRLHDSAHLWKVSRKSGTALATFRMNDVRQGAAAVDRVG
jgi:hypothetical protein